MASRSRPYIGLYAIVAAGAALLISPLLALAYFDTADGVEYLDGATVAAWAVPARELAGGLVTFTSPDRVYATYSQILALMFPAVILTALAARSERPLPRKRLERVGWGVALAGYGLFAAGTMTFGLSVIPADPVASIGDVAFLAMMLPGMLLTLIGSTILGIALVRSGYQPRLTAWLLTFAVPLFLLGSIVLGHNGIGIVPLMIAWAATGWRWRSQQVASRADTTDQPLARHA